MNAKMLAKVIEVENRVNTICKCLVIGEADHFQVEYDNHEVQITAYSYQQGKANKLTDLMRIFAEPEDKIETKNLATDERLFWTCEMSISLK